MTLNLFKSIVLVGVLSLGLVLAHSNTVSAATLTATETVANVASVAEVKASRTLTVGSLPVTTETITIGTCAVTFATTTAGSPAEDANCTGGATILTSKTPNDTARTAAEIATALRTMTNVSDTGHGALTVGGSGSTASYTTTGTEASATAVTFTDGTGGNVTSTGSTTGVVPVTAVAQVVNFAPGSEATGSIFTATINGTNYSYTFNSGTLSSIVGGLRNLVDADAAVNCTDGGSVVICTAVSAGTLFTYSTAVSESASSYTPSKSRGGSASSNATVYTQPRAVVDNSRAITAIKAQLSSLIAQLIKLLQEEISQMSR